MAKFRLPIICSSARYIDNQSESRRWEDARGKEFDDEKDVASYLRTEIVSLDDSSPDVYRRHVYNRDSEITYEYLVIGASASDLQKIYEMVFMKRRHNYKKCKEMLF